MISIDNTPIQEYWDIIKDDLMSALNEFFLKRANREGWLRNDMLTEVWKLGILPKIAAFWWLCLQNKILTMDNLMKRGI